MNAPLQNGLVLVVVLQMLTGSPEDNGTPLTRRRAKQLIHTGYPPHYLLANVTTAIECGVTWNRLQLQRGLQPGKLAELTLGFPKGFRVN